MDLDDGGAPPLSRPSGRRATAVVAGMLLVLLLGFVGLALAISDGGDLAFDRPVMMWVHETSTPWLTTAAHGASFLGGRAVLVTAVALAVVLFVMRRIGGAFFVLAAVYGASRLNAALKPAFERSRPEFWEHLSVEYTLSFPSGHAMGSMSIAAPLVILAWGTRFRWAALITAAVYVLAVGWSRVYVGVHFPSDVLAGWCITVFWVGILALVLLLLAGWIRRRAPALATWL